MIEVIMQKRTNEDVLVDRPTLVHWLLNLKRNEYGVDQDHYAFQVLTLDIEGEEYVFWRVNQAKSKFLKCGDPAWQREQQDKKYANWGRQKRESAPTPWVGYRGSGKGGGKWVDYKEWDYNASSSCGAWRSPSRWEG